MGNRLKTGTYFVLVVFMAGVVFGADWPQLQNGPQRHGYSAENIDTPISKTWAHGFYKEHLHPQSQPVTANGLLFIGTEHGTFYAFNANNGDMEWDYKTAGPILHTAGVEGGRVFFGDKSGCVYALNASDGGLVWRLDTNSLGDHSGFSTAVLLVEGKVFIASRRGTYYAIEQADGTIAWQVDIGAPVLMSSAYDNGRIFFGAMDMRCRALDAANGDTLWTSGELTGTAFKDYWPVCYDGKVILRPMQISGADVPGITMDHWYPGPQPQQEINDQLARIATLESNPLLRNMFCLDQVTGAETVIMHWSICTMNGAPPPPCVDGDGLLINPCRVIDWRGGWCRVNLSQRVATELLCESHEWSGGNPPGTGNKDENLCASAAGRLVFVFHTQEANAQYTGVWHLDRRQWTQMSPYGTDGWWWSNTQGGGTCPVSISNGKIYHTTQNTLNCRTAAAGQ